MSEDFLLELVSYLNVLVNSSSLFEFERLCVSGRQLFLYSFIEILHVISVITRHENGFSQVELVNLLVFDRVIILLALIDDQNQLLLRFGKQGCVVRAVIDSALAFGLDVGDAEIVMYIFGESEVVLENAFSSIEEEEDEIGRVYRSVSLLLDLAMQMSVFGEEILVGLYFVVGYFGGDDVRLTVPASRVHDLHLPPHQLYHLLLPVPRQSSHRVRYRQILPCQIVEHR